MDVIESAPLPDTSDNDGSDFEGFTTVGPGGKRQRTQKSSDRPAKINRVESAPPGPQIDIDDNNNSLNHSQSPTSIIPLEMQIQA